MKKSFLLLLLVSVVPAWAQPPNILFIAVDDLRPELGVYESRAITPNLDKLAASSLVFERAYCNQAVCGASRTSLMTGLYPEKTGLRSFHVEGWEKKLNGVVTLNHHLKDNGYLTLGLGKIYHDTAGHVDKENWSQWFPLGTERYFAPASLKLVDEAGKLPKPLRGPATEVSPGPEEQHLDYQRATLASEILSQLSTKSEEGPVSEMADKPFFLAVGFTKPHLPFVAPQKYWDLYDPAQFNMPTNLAIPPGYPEHAANLRPGELYNYGDIPRSSPAEFPDELNRRLIHGYHAATSFTDANIGRVLDSLEKNGFAENTIVILWGDHGWKLGDHHSWCKHTNLEVDARVPLIVRVPSISSAVGKTDSLVELIDMYPTLSELAGLETPQHVQGKSFVPVLREPTSSIRDTAYSSYPARVNGKNTIGNSIRTEDFRYTEWWDGDKPVHSILTNLSEDPGETTAVKDEGVREELSGKLKNRVLQARK